MNAADIKKHITFHCSRHTFAIHCIISGIDVITVRDWLGHKTVTTTEIYAKIAAQYKDESMKKMDGFWAVAEEGERKKKPEKTQKLDSPKPIVMQAKRDLDKIIAQVHELKHIGLTNTAIAKKFAVSGTTVAEWLRRKVHKPVV